MLTLMLPVEETNKIDRCILHIKHVAVAKTRAYQADADLGCRMFGRRSLGREEICWNATGFSSKMAAHHFGVSWDARTSMMYSVGKSLCIVPISTDGPRRRFTPS